MKGLSHTQYTCIKNGYFPGLIPDTVEETSTCSLQGASSPGGKNQIPWRLLAPRGHAVKICPSRWVGAVGIPRGQQGRPGAQVWGAQLGAGGSEQSLTGEEDQVGVLTLTGESRGSSDGEAAGQVVPAEAMIICQLGHRALLPTRGSPFLCRAPAWVLTDLCLDLWSQEVDFPLSLALLLSPGKQRALRRGFC